MADASDRCARELKFDRLVYLAYYVTVFKDRVVREVLDKAVFRMLADVLPTHDPISWALLLLPLGVAIYFGAQRRFLKMEVAPAPQFPWLVARFSEVNSWPSRT